MSVTPSPEGSGKVILQLSKPFLSQEEILYCHRIQGIVNNHTEGLMYETFYNNKKNEMMIFLQKLIKILRYPTNVLELTMNYYQRFYMFNKFDIFKNAFYEIAVTSLFISSKLQDYIKKLRDIVKVVNDDMKLAVLNITENKILQLEKQFLQTINFDFRFQNCEELVLRIGHSLKLDEELKYVSWLINNDTYVTDLHVKFPCNVVALACIKLACKLQEKQVEISNKDFRIFKDSFILVSMEEILKYYMDHYSSSYLCQKFTSTQQIMDKLITLKIEISGEIASLQPGKKSHYKYQSDDFFKIDRNFNKQDNVRFVYQKLNYIDEL